MTVIRALVTIPNASSPLPRDVSQNTWHFRAGDAAAAVGPIHDALTTFYNAIDVYLSSFCQTPATVKYYNLADPVPRPPISEDTIALTVGAGVSHPNEVALCLSYRAPILAGTLAARRRGRIYLGPLDYDVSVNGTGDVTVPSTPRTNICNAAQALAEDPMDGEAGWVVFSPTSAGPPPWTAGQLDDSSYDVTAGWVDNALDTVRSRGLAPTARTVFTLD